MLWIITAVTVSYILGSIPTAYIFGRLIKGIDIRKFGSGNVGATNALRVLGRGAGIVVLLLDILKGFLAVTFLGNIFSLKITVLSQEFLGVLLGVACILGHNWTVFLRFKGGKGIATTLGVLVGLACGITGLRIALLLLVLTWLTVFLVSRIVSVASLLSALVLPLYLLFLKQSHFLVWVSIILSLLIIWRHKSNLSRILRGKEPRLQFKKPQ